MNNIFGISIKNWVDFSVLEVVLSTFIFPHKILPWFLALVSQKMNFIKTSFFFGLFYAHCILIKFCSRWTYIALFQWFFDEIDFLADPEGTNAEFFQQKQGSTENTSNTHKSSHFFVLIPNMLLVSIKIPFVRLKPGKHQRKTLETASQN